MKTIILEVHTVSIIWTLVIIWKASVHKITRTYDNGPAIFNTYTFTLPKKIYIYITSRLIPTDY
jgi:hypothetical protein